MASGSASASQTSGSEQNTVQVPDWLQPFFDQAVGTAGSALGGLSGAVNQDTVADFTPEQLQSFEMMKNFIGGAGNFLPTAQNTFLDAAQGVGTGFLDPTLQKSLSGSNFDFADYIGQGKAATDFTNNPISREALNATARGDYLFGGEGFDAAVDAAVRAAQPHIASSFGGTVGGVGSGLAKHAVGQSAIDAFANQYANERRNQVGAASDLEAGGRQDRATFLGFGESGANRARRGDEMLAGLSDEERRRQMMAAGQLPGIGSMDAEMLMGVGDIMQGQNQRELDAPMRNQMMLLQAALSGLPLSDFFGSNRDYEEQTLSAKAGFKAGA